MLSHPMAHWHILPILIKASRSISAETCGLDDVFPPDDLRFGPAILFMSIYVFRILDAY